MTEEQRIAELMKPRYKVIEGWPGSENFPFHKGDIIIQNKQGKAWESIHGRNVYFGVNPDMHPHLFKRLEWHEERKQEEMPEYVKWADGRVVKVGLECNIAHIFPVPAMQCSPATESEYLQHINSKPQP